LRNPHFAHGRADTLELPHHLAHKVRVSIDGLGQRHQSARARFIDSLQPTRDGYISQQQRPPGLDVVPTASDFECKNREPLGGWIVRAICWSNATEAGIFDSQLFAQHRDFGIKALVVSGKPYTLDWAIDAPRTSLH